MDLESAIRTGPSAQATAAAHHRVCPRRGRSARDQSHAATGAGLQRACCCLAVEGRPLLWRGLHAPPRRDAALPRGQNAAPYGAPPGNRWQFARALQCQNPRLSRLPRALPVSVAWGGHAQTTANQSAAPSAPHWLCAAPASRDWSRREHRRACLELVRAQRVDIGCAPPPTVTSPAEVILSRAQRAHMRLSWETRLARNARRGAAGQLTLTLFGVPNDFARQLGLMVGG